MIRLSFAFILAPLLGSLLIWAVKGNLHSIKVACAITYTMALVFWLPILLSLRRRRWLGWWQVTLGTVVGAVLIVMLYSAANPVHFEKYGAFNSLLIVADGVAIGIMFWIIGIVGNKTLAAVAMSVLVDGARDGEGERLLPAIVVRHTNTFVDALAFATAQNLSSAPLLIFTLVGAAIAAWFCMPIEPDMFNKVVFFELFTLTIFATMMAFQLLFNAYWFASNRDKNFLTEHSTELTEPAFICSTVHTRVEINWLGVLAVRVHLNRLFIFESATRAHCIPARAFASRREFEAFASQANYFWHRARQS